MQAKERKKIVPGTHSILSELRSIKEKIKESDSLISSYHSKISEINTKERQNSPRQEFINKRTEIKEEMRKLRSEKKILYDQKEALSMTLDNTRTESKSNEHEMQFTKVDDIEKRLKTIELKRISSALSIQEEKKLNEEVGRLQRNKKRIEELETCFKTQAECEAKMKILKGQIRSKVGEIKVKTEELNEIEKSIEQLTEQHKTKSPVILTLEKNITEQKKIKSDLIEKRKNKQAELHDKEIEYAKFLDNLKIQQDLESGKQKIREKISTLVADKSAYLFKKEKYDSAVFDNLKDAVQSLIISDNYGLEVDLAFSLNKNSIPIPKNNETAKKCLEMIDEKKRNSVAEFASKNKEIDALIVSIDEEVAALNRELSEMPETDFTILKRSIKNKE